MSIQTAVREVPRLPGAGHSLQYLRDPYRFISRACRQMDSDIVELRLMMQPTLGMSGARAAELFYDKAVFARALAAPEAVRATLFGKGGVQGLDGAEHLSRKRFFMEATTPQRVDELVTAARHCWDHLAPRWSHAQRFTLYTFAQDWLGRAVCRWAGVPLPAHEARKRIPELVALFDQAGSGALAHVRSRRARRSLEHWLAGHIDSTRAGTGPFDPGHVAHEAAFWTDAHGELLPSRVAAVELLNVLRPTVAVSVFIVLAAHALQHHPDWAQRLDDEAQLEAFVQEVRRFYPFFPAVAARVLHDTEWNGLRLPAGRRAMLDLYGTNHDPRCWEAPDEFRPERFVGRTPGPFDFVPQGGARAQDHHRCPGEGVAAALMKLALRLLAQSSYEVPAQDLRIRFERMPALPVSGLVLERFNPRRNPG